MKNRVIAVCLAACICICALVLPSSGGLAQNNDAKYDNYVNMLPNTDSHARYVVPNLYRQDASYINVKTFPLVVNGGIEYFPLDIFALYSYLQVVYSRITQGFYINNTKNNHYVAFDMETGTTTTHNAQMLDIEAKIFNRTYYVPAAKVCEILGMNFESYDNPESGIRAARISDSRAKMTLDQLVAAYSPAKKEPVENPPDGTTQTPLPNQPENDNPPPNGDISSDNPPQGNPDGTTEVPDVTEVPRPEDKYLKVRNRYIHMIFDATGSDNASDTLYSLARNGIKAAFFVDKEFILTNPDTVRRMMAEGHLVGIYFSPVSQDGQTLSHEDMLSAINDTNDALHLVTKSKTRYVCAQYGYGGSLIESGFDSFALDNGYHMCVSTFDAGASDYYNASQRDRLVTRITGDRPDTERTVVVRFTLKNGTPALMEALFEFTHKYPRFIPMDIDEYTFA